VWQRLLRFSTCLLLGDGGVALSLIAFFYSVPVSRWWALVNIERKALLRRGPPWAGCMC